MAGGSCAGSLHDTHGGSLTCLRSTLIVSTGFARFLFLDIKALSLGFPADLVSDFQFSVAVFGPFEVALPIVCVGCSGQLMLANSTFKVVSNSISEHPCILNVDMNEPEDCGYVIHNSNTNVVHLHRWILCCI